MHSLFYISVKDKNKDKENHGRLGDIAKHRDIFNSSLAIFLEETVSFVMDRDGWSGKSLIINILLPFHMCLITY